MNQDTRVRCPGCLCNLEPTDEYGVDIQRCPQCGDLWMDHRGINRLRAHLHEKRLDLGLSWQELGGVLSGGLRPTRRARR